MVLFNNVNVNQKVELLYRGQILSATVRYKGPVRFLDGDWVGLELDEPLGRHNGLYRGVKYFESRIGHGVFVRANVLRFIRNTKRRLRDRYFTIGTSSVDEGLFGLTNSMTQEEDEDNSYITKRGYTAPDFTRKQISSIDRPSHYHRMRSVSHQIAPATMNHPLTAAAPYTYTSTPVNQSYSRERRHNEFYEPVPTIPKTHMPLSAQLSQTKRGGWSQNHWVREINCPRAKQHMKYSAWNDISY